MMPLNAPASVPLGWPEASATSRPWTRWWWMGSAVNDADLTRELERFSAAFTNPPALRAMFHDSYEYISNWAPGLPEAFEVRDGRFVSGSQSWGVLVVPPWRSICSLLPADR